MTVAFLYNDIFRNSSFGKNHPVLPKRISNVYDFTKLINLRKKVDYVENKKANFKTLQLFHSFDYLEILKKTEKTQCISKDNARKYNLGTYSNPIFKQMFSRHATSTGALILAADLIKKKYKYVFSPGSGAHHAKQSMADGFCYLNDIAIAILVLKAKGYKKILYFDMDAHYGDGIIEYFKKNQEVCTISIHQENLWPKTGTYLYDSMHNTYNFPVSEGFNDSNFKKITDEIIFKIIKKFSPEVTLMQMGADCLKYDKMSKMELSNNSMSYIIKIMKSLSEKIIVMGGGGYNPWITIRAWTYNLATLAGETKSLKINKKAKDFLNNIKYKNIPKHDWINYIKDEPDIF
tara:strand:+ start:2673 stop:3716 length:1044 start_codon:yes stop_codon:yes gene_type:complete